MVWQSRIQFADVCHPIDRLKLAAFHHLASEGHPVNTLAAGVQKFHSKPQPAVFFDGEVFRFQRSTNQPKSFVRIET